MVDYIAMDVKAILKKYHLLGVESKKDVESIKKSIEYLKKQESVDYEFRITVTPIHLPFEDIKEYGELLKGAKKLFLQQFSPTNTLDESWKNKHPYSREDIEKISDLLNQYVDTKTRGV